MISFIRSIGSLTDIWKSEGQNLLKPLALNGTVLYDAILDGMLV